MTSPLDQKTYDQTGGYLPIKLMPSDDLPGIVIGMPFIITGYTFDGEVFDDLGNVLFNFNISITQAIPTGIISASLTDLQITALPKDATYRIRWTTGTTTRTFLYGPIEVIAIW